MYHEDLEDETKYRSSDMIVPGTINSHDTITPDEFHMDTFEMDDTLVGVDESDRAQRVPGKGSVTGIARHTLGLILLLFVVFLWTASTFLGSSIFADASYAKPFFLTYLDTSCFTLLFIPRLISYLRKHIKDGTLSDSLHSTFSLRTLKAIVRGDRKGQYMAIDEEESFLKTHGSRGSTGSTADHEKYLDAISTARYSLHFCILWFVANYFAMACLQFTTVASTTILTSTSSIWTLLFGAFSGTEKFTWKKLCGVLASLVGIVLISQVDLSSGDSKSGATKRAIQEFPDKSASELALGDIMALLSAVIYGVYTIVLKKTTISALPRSIHMPTFFAFIGLFNMIFLLPLFPILHFTHLETFGLPPSAYIWVILIINAFSSLVSDIAWAHAMILTSPLVVTVGMSLTIPLSLIGEMIIQGRFESWIYWIGAMIVVGSFVFVEREEKHEEKIPQVEVHEDTYIGEPGPAILISDYDEMLEELERRKGPPSPTLTKDVGVDMDTDVSRPR